MPGKDMHPCRLHCVRSFVGCPSCMVGVCQRQCSRSFPVTTRPLTLTTRPLDFDTAKRYPVTSVLCCAQEPGSKRKRSDDVPADGTAAQQGSEAAFAASSEKAVPAFISAGAQDVNTTNETGNTMQPVPEAPAAEVRGAFMPGEKDAVWACQAEERSGRWWFQQTHALIALICAGGCQARHCRGEHFRAKVLHRRVHRLCEGPAAEDRGRRAGSCFCGVRRPPRSPHRP